MGEELAMELASAMEWALVMVLALAMVLASAMAWLVMLLLTQLPMPLRSTLTRSPPTYPSMPWLTTTLDPVSTSRSPTMAPLPGRDITQSTCLTEGSSTSTITPTTLTDMLRRSLTMAPLPSPLPLLVSVMASPTVVLSVMASLMVVSLVMVLELPTEESLISAENLLDKRPAHLFIYLSINMKDQ